MRNLIISIVCLLFLIIPWGIYDRYSSHTIEAYQIILTHQIIPSIEMGNWQEAEEAFDVITEDWERYRTVSAYFINGESINEVDSSLAKARYYIKLHSPANAAAEASYLIHRFEFLHENELPSPGNIL